MSADDCDLVEWLEAWYLAHCDGDWEHRRGVKIDTLDNPGWAISLDVGDELGSAFEPVQWADGEEWMDARVEDGQLRIACGPHSLRRALILARDVLAH